MYTYRTTYTTIDTVAAEALAGVLVATSIIGFIVAIVTIIGLWKVFTKAGKPGWASLIPFYNLYTLFTIAGMNGWMFLLLLIPIVNIVMTIMVWLNVAKAFGKSTGFAVGLIFLGPIFLLILAFGNAQYIGAPNQTQTQTPIQQ